jgi:hypothetical protein
MVNNAVMFLGQSRVCGFCLAIRMISSAVLLLNQNGFSLRRALADNFIIAKRIRRSLKVFTVHCSLHLQSSLNFSLDRTSGTDSHSSPDARG